MKPSRRLALQRESLTELDADELARAGGGWAPPTYQDDCTRQLTLHRYCSWSCTV